MSRLRSIYDQQI